MQEPVAAAGDWQAVIGVDAGATAFPARAKVGDESIVLFRSGAKYFGVERACPHQGGSMLAAVLQGESLIRCTRHNYVFRIANGKPVNCPGFRLTVYEVKQEGGQLFARLVLAAG